MLLTNKFLTNADESVTSFTELKTLKRRSNNNNNNKTNFYSAVVS